MDYLLLRLSLQRDRKGHVIIVFPSVSRSPLPSLLPHPIPSIFPLGQGSSDLLFSNIHNQLQKGMLTLAGKNIIRTLVVEDELTQKVKVIPIELSLCEENIPLRGLLAEMVPELSSRAVITYDFHKDSYVALLAPAYLLPLAALHPSNLILLRIAPPVAALSSNPSTITSRQGQEKSQTSSLKKQRSKERVIFQVIEIVKRWREIHQSKNNIKKVSLQEAARIVGLPKKSLDDYYYQLRLGEKYDFDFRAHLFDRIGVLRNYLKNLKDHFKLDKNQKHPKKLKVIDEFEQISELFHRNGHQRAMGDMQEQGQEVEYEEDQMKMEADELNQQESKGIHHHFYNEFEYLMNEKDPFLACDYNFKKKGVEEGAEEGDFFF